MGAGKANVQLRG
jgi:hypothetical protein